MIELIHYTATFIGHRECPDLDRSRISEQVKNLIDAGYDKFLCGGMGQFDWLCAKCVSELKSEFPHIKSHLIIPYLNFNTQNISYFDEIIYPVCISNYHFKSAILQRNKYLVNSSDAAICYINHDSGGAAVTYELAIKKGLLTVNLGSYEGTPSVSSHSTFL